MRVIISLAAMWWLLINNAPISMIVFCGIFMAMEVFGSCALFVSGFVYGYDKAIDSKRGKWNDP